MLVRARSRPLIPKLERRLKATDRDYADSQADNSTDQARRQRASDARASPPRWSGTMVKSSWVTPESSTS